MSSQKASPMQALRIEAPQPHERSRQGILFQFDPSSFRIEIDLPVVLPGARPPILDQHFLYSTAMFLAMVSTLSPFLLLPLSLPSRSRLMSPRAVAICMTVSSLYLHSMVILSARGPFPLVISIIWLCTMEPFVRNSQSPFLQPIASPTAARTMHALQFYSLWFGYSRVVVVGCIRFYYGMDSWLDQQKYMQLMKSDQPISDTSSLPLKTMNMPTIKIRCRQNSPGSRSCQPRPPQSHASSHALHVVVCSGTPYAKTVKLAVHCSA